MTYIAGQIIDAATANRLNALADIDLYETQRVEQLLYFVLVTDGKHSFEAAALVAASLAPYVIEMIISARLCERAAVVADLRARSNRSITTDGVRLLRLIAEGIEKGFPS